MYFHLKIKIFVEKYIFCIKNTVVLLLGYTNTVWPKGLSIKIEFNKKFKSLIVKIFVLDYLSFSFTPFRYTALHEIGYMTILRRRRKKKKGK